MRLPRRIPPLYAGLILALAAGIFLRLKGLTFQSFWNDELFSAWVSDPDRNLADVIRLTLNDVHPPFYQVVLWLWYSLFGYTEVAARFLSALFGAAGILTVFFLGKELFNSRVGLSAVILTSLNAFHLYYSQEVRSYALLFLLSSLSYLFFLKLLKGFQKKYFFLYLAATLLLVYTHYYGFYVVLSQGLSVLFYVVFLKDKRRRIILTFLPAGLVLGLASTPLFPTLLARAETAQSWIPKPEWTYVLSYFSSYFKDNLLIVVFSVLIMISVAGLIPVSGSKRRAPMLVLWTWVFSCLGLPFLQSLLFAPTLTTRNTIIVLPAIIILIGAGLETIRPPLARIAILSSIVILSIVYLFPEIAYYRTVFKQQWREIAQKVQVRDEPLYGLKWTPDLWNVYLKQSGSALRVEPVATLIKKIETQEIDKPSFFWILDVHPKTDKDLPQRFGFVGIARLEMNGVYANLYGYGLTLTSLESLEVSEPYAVSDGALVMAGRGFVRHVSPPLGPGTHTVLVVAKGSAAAGGRAKLRISVFRTDDLETGLLAEKIIPTAEEYDIYSLDFILNDKSAVSVKAEFIDGDDQKRTKENRDVFFKGFHIR